MNKADLAHHFNTLSSDWDILVKVLLFLFLFLLVNVFIYDRYVQRKNQLLINYPLIGRLRYIFYALRNPMRQYFGDETFYDSFEKIEWINRVAQNKSPYLSFSPAKPYANSELLFKYTNHVKEPSEVTEDFHVTFGPRRAKPFTARSIVGRSAMSDGSISPEGTRAFARGAYSAGFPINTGEGGLTSNFLTTLKYRECNEAFLEVKHGTPFARSVKTIVRFFTNKEIARRIYRKMVLRRKDKGTFIFDEEGMNYFRINWDADLASFPEEVPESVPDIILQMGSGLYGVRDNEGAFDAERYQKVMRFCRMSEVKIAQGAKQTGGKLLAAKVSEDIAYYRGVPAHQDLISPNRFPYAGSMEELYDFIERLQTLSQKPVGFKTIVSSREQFEEYVRALAKRKEEGKEIVDFITIDGGDGGSATAPLEMMSRIGLPIQEALEIVDDTLKAYGLREEIIVVAAEKVLTPDDVVELLCYGADFVNIARGFMISAGCIRARECSGANGRHCPVGLATMDEGKRSKFLIEKKSRTVANYHNALIEGVRNLMAVMGKARIRDFSKEDLMLRETHHHPEVNVPAKRG